jgi:hypothetical protein
MADRIAGLQSFFNFGGAIIPITKMTPEVDRKLADSTDSSDYNSTANILGPTQIPVSAMMKASIEGRFHKSVVPSAVMSMLFTGATQIPCQIGLDLSPTMWGHGLIDLSNFRTDIPVDDVVNFTAQIQSYGLWQANN